MTRWRLRGAAPAPLSYYAALLRARREFSEQRCLGYLALVQGRALSKLRSAVEIDRIDRKRVAALFDGQERPRPARSFFLQACRLASVLRPLARFGRGALTSSCSSTVTIRRARSPRIVTETSTQSREVLF